MRVRWDRTRGRPEPIAALNRVLEKENGEPLVDLCSIAPELVIIRPEVIPYVRQKVAEMVRDATSILPSEYRLGVVDAWRPLERQQRIYDFFYRCAQEAFPERSHASLRRLVCRWVAPTDQKAPPGHCTGAALDFWLLDDQGNSVDVSEPYERFQAAMTFTEGLSQRAGEARMVLYETLTSIGFSNCRDEWWHYSYGDAGWAVRMGEPSCPYGIAPLDPELYTAQERLSVRAYQTRHNPFLK